MEYGNAVFKKLVQSMNRSLPQQRQTLEQLMHTSQPSIKNRNGTTSTIAREELEKMAEIIPEYNWNRLLIPIIIEMTPDFGESCARIRGTVECNLIMRLLDLKKTADTFIILYLHEIRALRKALPTSTQYGYYISVTSDCTARHGNL